MSSDSQLLERYAREGDQAAFAEVVQTHIDLVYSAALRRVGSDRHAAAEITQDVFIALARRASQLARHPVLNAWLYTTTRNASIDFHRRAQRRLRQQQDFSTMDELPATQQYVPDWNHLRELLDPALDELGELDRRILILRFFENRSFADIGDSLGLREDAARMRVARALDKLRLHLSRRGVASTAAALGGLLGAHAVVAAPAGLAATVSTAAITAGAAMTGTVGIFHFMNITKLAASAVGLLVCASVAALLYKKNPESAVSSLAAAAPGVPASVSLDGSPPAQNLESLVRQQNANHVSSATMAAEEKIAILRDMLARLPDQNIPELKLTTNSDWHVAVEGALETTDDYRRALAKLRSLAEGRFAKLFHPALLDYVRTNAQFPTGLAQLEPFVSTPIDREMLQRYRVAPSSEIPNVRVSGEYMITQDRLIDSEFDTHIVIGSDGFGACSSRQSSAYREAQTLMSAIKAHHGAHGRGFDDIAQLLPYATTSEQKAIIEKRIAERRRPNANPESESPPTPK